MLGQKEQKGRSVRISNWQLRNTMLSSSNTTPQLFTKNMTPTLAWIQFLQRTNKATKQDNETRATVCEMKAATCIYEPFSFNVHTLNTCVHSQAFRANETIISTLAD